jgi:hypothetical protein
MIKMLFQCDHEGCANEISGPVDEQSYINVGVIDGGYDVDWDSGWTMSGDMYVSGIKVFCPEHSKEGLDAKQS